MIYLYAYSNHRSDLEHLRRMGALWRVLDQNGVAAELIVNDYRAQLAGRELGLSAATTIENIMELDALVGHDDILVIDSPEDAGKRLEYYVQKYRRVFRVTPCKEQSRYGEELFELYSGGMLVDEIYFKTAEEKRRRAVLIYGDSDWDKTLLKASSELAKFDLELYWGIYFHVKYEDELAQRFKTIHESEEYVQVIRDFETVITAMPQSAAEAAAAGAKVLWLDRGRSSSCIAKALKDLGVTTIPWGEWERLPDLLEELKPASFYNNLLQEWAKRLISL